jgi:hypothetical protein
MGPFRELTTVSFRDEPPCCCSLPNRSAQRIRSVSYFPFCDDSHFANYKRRENASDSHADIFFPFAAARGVKKSAKQMLISVEFPRIWKNGARTLGAKAEGFLENGGFPPIGWKYSTECSSHSVQPVQDKERWRPVVEHTGAIRLVFDDSLADPASNKFQEGPEKVRFNSLRSLSVMRALLTKESQR